MGRDESKSDNTLSKLEGQIDQWGHALDELVAKAEVDGRKAKTEVRAQLDELKQKLRATREQLAAAKAAGAGKWDAFKDGVERSWKELESSFQKLAR